MTTFFRVARGSAVIAGGFAAGLVATSTLFPAQAKATDCGEPTPTTTELVSLEVPEADREFWQARTIDVYGRSFSLVETSSGERVGYWKLERLGDLPGESEP
jgi:hypothetical protein